MRNAKRFLAVLLASTMTLQTFTPVGAEMIIDTAADAAPASDEGNEEVDEPADMIEDSMIEDAPVEDGLSDEGPIEDGFSEDALPDDAFEDTFLDDAFEDIETDAFEAETEPELIEDPDLELTMAALDEFDQTDVVIDANDFAPFKGRTKAQVEQKYGNALSNPAADDYVDGDKTTYYTTPASTSAPYAQGVLASSTILTMNEMTDFYRWLTGMGPLSARVTTNSDRMQCEALDRNFQFAHYISSTSKPSDMSSELWEKGFMCTHNILARYSTPRGSITSWMNEGYSLYNNSFGTFGHRLALIGEDISGVEFGYSGNIAVGKDYKTNANGIQGAFAAFPAPGYMPNDLLTAATSGWSFYPNTDKVNVTSGADVKVRVTDMSTGSSYICTTADGTLQVAKKEINFKQPTPAGGLRETYKVPYKVEIIGLKDSTGKSAKVQYTVNFVDVSENAPSKIKSYSIHAQAVLTKVDESDEWLSQVRATMPASVYAKLETGREITVPVKGEWKLDKTNKCFTATIDTSALPSNIRVPATTGTTVTVPYEQMDGYTTNSIRLNIYYDNSVVGDDVLFHIYKYYLNCNRAEIYRISPSSGSAYTGKKVYDSYTSPEFSYDNGNFTFKKKAALEDNGTYMAVQYVDSGSSTSKYRFVSPAAKTLTVKRNFEKTTVSGITAKTYTGSKITQTVKVMDGTKLLTENKDYEIRYDVNINVGTNAEAWIWGMGEYSGLQRFKFEIKPKQIPKPTITGTYTYNGSAITPSITVRDAERGVYLTSSDYTVNVSNNIKPGTATVTVTGKGNYTGTASATFTIKREVQPIQASWFDAIKDQTYTGSLVRPLVTGTDPEISKALIQGTDFYCTYANNTNVGTATVTVTGINDYKGTLTLNYKIVPKQLPAVSATTDQTYTGKLLTTRATIKDTSRSVVLAEDTDYTLSYRNNRNVGTATITATGKGNYTGSVTATFKISPRKLPAPEAMPVMATTGQPLKQDIKIKNAYTGNYLVEGTDFTASYTNNVTPGTATVTITGKGNYTGTQVATFEITEKIYSLTWHGDPYFGFLNPETGKFDLTEKTVTGVEGSKQKVPFGWKSNYDYYVLGWYTDPNFSESSKVIGYTYDDHGGLHMEEGYSEITLNRDMDVYPKWKKYSMITFTVGNYKDADIDYVEGQSYYRYIKATNSALYAVREGTIINFPNITFPEGSMYTFEGWYENGKRVTRTFTAAEDRTFVARIKRDYDFTAEVTGEAHAYTGKAVKAAVVVKDKYDGHTLKAGTDYTVTYSNNIKPGMADINIIGAGNYKGKTWTEQFMIGFSDVQDASAYYFKPVYWASSHGIAGGFKEDNTFRPQDPCTRGQMVTFLWRMAGKPNPKSLRNPFTDLDSSAYYYKAVLWAVEKGITKGYSEDNTFRPDIACQREHAVMFLWRLAGKPSPKTTVNPFTDISTADYYYWAALWASENKIARGYTQEDGSSTYRPTDDCMREHIVTFLYRF